MKSAHYNFKDGRKNKTALRNIDVFLKQEQLFHLEDVYNTCSYDKAMEYQTIGEWLGANTRYCIFSITSANSQFFTLTAYAFMEDVEKWAYLVFTRYNAYIVFED